MIYQDASSPDRSPSPLSGPPEPAPRSPRSLRDVLEEQLTLLRVAVLEDGGLDPTIRDDLGRLIERFHRELEQTARRPAPELARWIHSLGFALYEQLGASLEPAWARRWIYLDLQIEAHLRLNGLGETIDQVYGLPWAKAG